MNDLFEVASGSVIGAEHKRRGVNNQDAYCVAFEEDAIIALVCDGCSSGFYSEVGANIGARLILESIGRNLHNCWDWNKGLERIRQEVLAKIRILALDMGGSFSQNIYQYFLFTVIGTILKRDETIIFSIGDGFFSVDGEKTTIGPFPKNEPPYMAYDLVSSNPSPDFKFNIQENLVTGSFNNLLIGSDGVSDLVKIEDKIIPGTKKDEEEGQKVGSIDQFWGDDNFFQKKYTLQRFLFRLNRTSIIPHWDAKYLETSNGLLPDDTTIIAIRLKN
jgi:hypothetical protein